MSGNWETGAYRERARQWRERAAEQPPGKERDACAMLAEGYDNLVALIERSGDHIRPTCPRTDDDRHA